ncbi:MAG: hypothetical protein ACLSEY_11245 [Enterocloster sp.]
MKKNILECQPPVKLQVELPALQMPLLMEVFPVIEPTEERN